MTLRPIKPLDNEEAKELIIAGLKEYYPEYDYTMNQDLNNLFNSYTSEREVFLVAIEDNKIIATGGLKAYSDNVAKIERMHIKKEHRGQNLGSIMLKQLECYAKEYKYNKIILETTSTWKSAIRFYQKNNYVITHMKDGDTYFEK